MSFLLLLEQMWREGGFSTGYALGTGCEGVTWGTCIHALGDFGLMISLVFGVYGILL